MQSDQIISVDYEMVFQSQLTESLIWEQTLVPGKACGDSGGEPWFKVQVF